MTKPETFSLRRVPPTLARHGTFPERFFDERSGSPYIVLTNGICTVVILGLASCGVIESFLKSDARTQGWLGQQWQLAIGAISDTKADRLDHCARENARMSACTLRQDLQGDLIFLCRRYVP